MARRTGFPCPEVLGVRKKTGREKSRYHKAQKRNVQWTEKPNLMIINEMRRDSMPPA